jgi:hypothetical protein
MKRIGNLCDLRKERVKDQAGIHPRKAGQVVAWFQVLEDVRTVRGDFDSHEVKRRL